MDLLQVLVPGWSGNGGCVLVYHSSVTSLNNEPGILLDLNTSHSFL